MDCVFLKFMVGLLNFGDEIFDINGESIVSKIMLEVYNIFVNLDKFVLIVLLFFGRKDW